MKDSFLKENNYAWSHAINLCGIPSTGLYKCLMVSALWYHDLGLYKLVGRYTSLTICIPNINWIWPYPLWVNWWVYSFNMTCNIVHIYVLTFFLSTCTLALHFLHCTHYAVLFHTHLTLLTSSSYSLVTIIAYHNSKSSVRMFKTHTPAFTPYKTNFKPSTKDNTVMQKNNEIQDRTVVQSSKVGQENTIRKTIVVIVILKLLHFQFLFTS